MRFVFSIFTKPTPHPQPFCLDVFTLNGVAGKNSRFALQPLLTRRSFKGKGVSFFFNFFVPAKKLSQKPRKLNLRSLINCSNRVEQVNSCLRHSNSTCLVVLSCTLIIRSDRLAEKFIVIMKGEMTEEFLKHPTPLLVGEGLGVRFVLSIFTKPTPHPQPFCLDVFALNGVAGKNSRFALQPLLTRRSSNL